MDNRGDRGFAASGLVVAVAVIVLVASVSFVLLAKRGGEEAAGAASGALDAAAESKDRQAQSTLRNALAAAKTAYTDFGNYGGVTAEMLAQIEPSLDFTGGASNGSVSVSVAVTEQQVGLAAMAETGTCWWMRDDLAVSKTTFGSGTSCTGQDALAGAAAASW